MPGGVGGDTGEIRCPYPDLWGGGLVGDVHNAQTHLALSDVAAQGTNHLGRQVGDLGGHCLQVMDAERLLDAVAHPTCHQPGAAVLEAVRFGIHAKQSERPLEGIIHAKSPRPLELQRT